MNVVSGKKIWPMSFSIVWTLIDKDIGYHSGQNLLWTHKVHQGCVWEETNWTTLATHKDYQHL